MNEELRIIIRAVTDEARRNMAAVREELEGIQDTSTESGKAVDTAMKGVARGAILALGAIAALTTAMASLGAKAQEVKKGFDKLNTTFANAGLTAGQASTTYKEIFSFLGEHDTAIEAAQSLALITNEEQKLAEWTNILQGAFAEMGEKLPTESLAEAANETIKVGKVVGTMADALNWACVSEDAFNEALAQTNSLAEREALVRSTLNNIYGNSAKIYAQNNQATKQYNEAQADLNLTLAQTSAYTTPLLTSLSQLSSTLLTFLAPALQTVALYLTGFIQLITEAIVWVGKFFGMFSDTEESTANIEGYEAAMKDYLESLQKGFNSSNGSMDETLDNINAIKKATMGFDELNIVSNPQSAPSIGGGTEGGGGSIAAMPKAPNPADYGIGNTASTFTNFNKQLGEAKKELEGLLALIGVIAAGLAAWKLADFINDIKKARKAWAAPYNPSWSKEQKKAWKAAADDAEILHNKIKDMIGYLLIAAGAMLAIKGYTDAWANGVDWDNIILMISGVALAVVGIGLVFPNVILQFKLLGSTVKLTAASIALMTAGIALMVVGVKDFIDNGPTLQNTILIIGGAVAIAVGLATAGLSVLVSAIIAVVAAVAALTAAILLEESAILSVDEAQKNHQATIEALMDAEMNYANVMDAAEAAATRLADAEKAAGMTGEELYKQVSDGTLTYGEMTDAQKELYKAYLDNEKKQADVEAATAALTEAKKKEKEAAWESQLALAKEGESYDECKKSVVAAFEAGELSAEEARDLLAKSMSEMSDDAQQTFMKDLPDSIKDGLNPSKYETTRKKIGDWFSKTWKDCKNAFKDVGEWFAGVGKKAGEAISSAFKTVLNWILDKIEKTVNAPFKMINGAIDILNAVPGVSISKLKLIDIPQLATGGITTGATMAMIGERGREAVLPLENNTGWMDSLADRIAARNNTPSKVVLMVDGKELGYATINSINDITRQTGNLQLITV